MSRHKYSCGTTFLDLLFNMLLAFVALFVLAFALSAQRKDVPDDMNAKISGEFLVELEWDYDADDDLDLWVGAPGGRYVFFNRREDGEMFLDRDDVGRENEMIRTETGIVEVRGNKEVVTIRSLVPGEYVANVFAYSLRPERPVVATVTVTRLRPWGIVASKPIELYRNGQEVTAFRFRVRPDGTVGEMSSLPRQLAGPAMDQYGPDGPPDEWGPGRDAPPPEGD